MEKLYPENNAHSKKVSHENISSKVVSLINKSLQNPGEDIGSRIDHIIGKVLSSIDAKCLQDELMQKKVFDEVCNFLNSLFKEIQMKKFYNNVPKSDLNSYAKKNLGTQMISNIYGKERKIFYRDEVNGGDCYYRTVLLKKLFDTLQSKGLSIENRIFVYDINWGHSGLIVRFQKKTYLADVSGFNHMFDKTISPVDDLNSLYKTKNFTKFSFNRKNDLGVCYFDDTKGFVDYISNKKLNSAAIEFNPKLIDGKDQNVRIELYKTYILFRLDGVGRKYYFDKKFIFSKLCKNPHTIFDYILKGLVADKEEKTQMKLYFDMLRNKVNPDKIYEIFD